MLARLERAALATTRSLAVAGLLILIGFAVMTLTDGLMRGLADMPIDVVRDLGGLVVAVAVTCCFPLAYLQRSNITIKFAATFLGKRASRICDALAAILVEAAAVFIAWQFLVYARQEAVGGDTTVMLEIKTAPFWYVMAALMMLAAVVQTLVVALDVARVLERDEARW
jgi:TRAP-type C4-dicarboxylate transport system permease small subunit